MYVTLVASKNEYLQNQWIGTIFPRRDVFSYIIIHNIYPPPPNVVCLCLSHWRFH
jgi:hypothetical protein